MFLGSLLYPHYISSVVSMQNLLDVVLQGSGDDHPCPEITVMVGDDQIVLHDNREVVPLGKVRVEDGKVRVEERDTLVQGVGEAINYDC